MSALFKPFEVDKDIYIFPTIHNRRILIPLLINKDRVFFD